MNKTIATNVKATKMSPPLKIASTDRKYIIGCSRSLGMGGEKFFITIKAAPTTNLSTKAITAYTNPLVSTKIKNEKKCEYYVFRVSFSTEVYFVKLFAANFKFDHIT